MSFRSIEGKVVGDVRKEEQESQATLSGEERFYIGRTILCTQQRQSSVEGLYSFLCKCNERPCQNLERQLQPPSCPCPCEVASSTEPCLYEHAEQSDKGKGLVLIQLFSAPNPLSVSVRECTCFTSAKPTR